jgi:low molecular weight protein-tyrosine phosphatase
VTPLPAGRAGLPALGPGPVGICLVCTGNICRSPMAEVVLRQLAAGQPGRGQPGGSSPGSDQPGSGEPTAATLGDRLRLSSAGTGPWHDGEPMDPRAAAALAGAGYRDHGHVARQFDTRRVDELDLLVALDRRHQQTLRSLTAGRLSDDRIVLLRSFDRGAGGAVDVPDPYYGGDAEFAACLAMIESACRGLVRDLHAALAVPTDP